MAGKSNWGQDRKSALANVEIISVAAAHHASTRIGDPALVRHIDTRFEDNIRNNERLAMLCRKLDVRGLQYCVFGGWLRDTIDGLRSVKLGSSPRDVDLGRIDIQDSQVG